MTTTPLRETVASFTTGSTHYRTHGFMKSEEAEELAELLWAQEHSSRLDLFLAGALGQALRAYTAQEWAYDPSEAPRRDAWIAMLREKLPHSMTVLEEPLTTELRIQDEWTFIPGEGRFKYFIDGAGVSRGSLQLREGFYILGTRHADSRRLIFFDQSVFDSEEDAVAYFNEWVLANPNTTTTH